MANIKLLLIASLFVASIDASSVSQSKNGIICLSDMSYINKMSYMGKKITDLLTVMMIAPEVITNRRDLGTLKVFNINKRFIVFEESDKSDTPHVVQNYNIEKELRGLSHEELADMLQTGNIVVTKSSNGDYNLGYQPLLLGGGPFLASVLGGTVRVVGYTTLVVGVGFFGWATAPFTAAAGGLTALMGGTGFTAGYIAKVEKVARIAYLGGFILPTA